MGTMYQDLGRAEIALKYYQEALQSNQYFFGTEENLQTGQMYSISPQCAMSSRRNCVSALNRDSCAPCRNSCHCIALAYSTLDNFKEALNWEKKNYHILSNLLGDKDFRTSESNIWLKQFTRKAVQVSKRPCASPACFSQKPELRLTLAPTDAD
jgi:protein TIF31